MPAEPLEHRRLRERLRRRGHACRGIAPMSGDVSARRYLRLDLGGSRTAVLVLYPPEIAEACGRFLAASGLLAAAGVPVPAVLDSDCGDGWMLVEDLGDRTLFDLADSPWERLRPYLEQAAALARTIAALPQPPVAALNPPLDRMLLERELRQTWELFLEPRGLTGGGDTAPALAAALESLCAALGEQPAVPCHRDFMARNLMLAGEAPGLAVLDHQDLRLGPFGYDLASLLNDSLFPPPAVEEALLAPFLHTAAERLGYHRAAAQRTLKAIGTFEAFSRRGFQRHLRLIPPTLSRALHHLERIPETGRLAAVLRPRWLAAARGGDAADLLD